MRIKKTMATFVAATMLFGSVGTAFAGTAQESFDRLKSLSLATGYTDGSAGLERNITRAEFAAIAVRALGLEKAAALAKGVTQFKDVPANHWASGYINLAVDAGVIKGYGDGTFKPNANVTYAEAITMMVRVLGYEPILTTGTYPTKYIAKAANIGLLDELDVTSYSVPALRGDVFKLTDKALDAKIVESVEQGDKKVYKVSDTKTLMMDKLGISETDSDAITAAGAVDGNKGEITFMGQTYKWALSTPAHLYKGVKGKVYWKQDGSDKKVVGFKPDGAIKEGKVESITSGTDAKIKIYGVGEFTEKSGYDIAGIAVGDYVRITLDSAGKVVNAVNLNYTDADVVKAVDAANQKIEFKKISTLDLRNVDSKLIEIIKDGKAATFSDIKAGDVVSYYGDNTKATIYVSSAVVTGKLTAAEAASSGVKLVIGGKNYYTTSAGVFTSRDGGETVSSTPTTNLTTLGADVVGKDVTAKLDAFGQVVYVQAGTSATAGNTFDAFVRHIYKKDDNGNITIKVQVTKLDGTQVEYEVDADADYVVSTDPIDKDGAGPIEPSAYAYGIDTTSPYNGATQDIVPLQFAKITLNSAGKIEKIEWADGKKQITAVNKDQNYVTVDSGSKFADANTKIVRVKKYGANDQDVNFAQEVEILSWESGKSYLKDRVTGGDYAVAYFKDGALKYVFVDSTASVTSGFEVAFVVGNAKVLGDGKWGATILQPGKSAVTMEFSGMTEGAISALANSVRLVKFNADRTKVTTVSDTTSPVINKTLTEVNELSSVYELKYTDGVTYISKTAKVFKNTDSGVVEGSISDIKKDKVVDIFNTLDVDGKVQTNPGDIVYDVVFVK